MSYNNLVTNVTNVTNSITNTNEKLDKIETFNSEKQILSREEKLDAFLESTVVDKFKQKWRDLTPFLRTNRLKFFINNQETLSEIEKESHLRKINNMILTGKLKPVDIDYNVETGIIEGIKGFKFE